MTPSGDHSTAEALGLLVKETQAILHLRMAERLRHLELSVPQYACLQALDHTPASTSSDLARHAFVSRQSMNVLLQGLEKRGLIERSEEPGPRRERATVLTPAAISLLGRARTEVAAVAKTMTGHLSASDTSRLLTLLSSCRDALVESGAG
ncbi:DNA-binding MarR family transcriptional regulator [Williamsia limnetica]|jgi:DNA-binding MarR family transcriptional regulator|uniref:DNA-binding MarR family transcriptional regulator n=1 Tax=Williamsia limnetica TaxID=882452 RepID=A0A318REE8_WILLI|nr:MarR family winged helix-turn-helix transcriptional regulator [Williamsia limnetica]PYE11974.1 DNA-binding MarR family transcriptional regulator [Williamsia limnetica]